MLLAQKYMPSKIDDLAGNDEAKTKIKQWALNWLRGVRQKPLLIHGPTGTGKTTVAYALKSEFNLELIEMNASDLRNAEQIEKVLASAGSALSLSGKSKLILIDDVDALQRDDRGGASAIVSVLKSSLVPILLTAENIWDKKLAGVRAESQSLDFRRISKSSVSKVLTKIAAHEKIVVPESVILSIAENCNGDLRSAINDLQAGAAGKRDREKDMVERVRTIFKSSTYKEAREASWGDVEHDFLKLWVDENIPIEYEKLADIVAAYGMLSRADIFDGRIMNRQYWGFLKYSNDLLTAGVSLAKKEKYYKFVHYQFPFYLRQMSVSASRRAMLREIGRKIGAKTHSGWKDSLNYIHLLKHILDRNPLSKDFYQFEDEEAAFLLEVPVTAIKEKFSFGKAKPEKEKSESAEEKSAKKKKAEKSASKKEKEKEPSKEPRKEKADAPSPAQAAKNSTLNEFL